MAPSKCDHCKEKIATDSYRLLLDGRRLHRKCFEHIRNPSYKSEAKISQLESLIDSKKIDIRSEIKSTNILRKVFNKPTNKHKALINDYKELISKHKKLLEDVSEFKFKKFKEFATYYDYWPERPPDWDSRSYILRKKVGKCEKCNRKSKKLKKLHAHHIVPISKGGNHLDSNLKVLCSKCHEKQHSHDFTLINTKENFGVLKKLKKIDRAIQNEETITFTYDTEKKSLERFSVTPLNIIYLYGVAIRCIDPNTGSKKIFPLKRIIINDPEKASSINKKLRILEKAMREGLLVHCVYTNNDGIKSERTLKPIRYSSYKGVNVINCYDYLRKTDRSFNPNRIDNAKIVDLPGNQRRL